MHLIYHVTCAQMAVHVQTLGHFLWFHSEYVMPTSLTQHIIHGRGIQLPFCKMLHHVQPDAETWISFFLAAHHKTI